MLISLRSPTAEQLNKQSAEISDASQELSHLRVRYLQVSLELDATRDDRDYLRESHAQDLHHIFSLERQLQEASSRQQELQSELYQVQRSYQDAYDELIRADRVAADLLDKEDRFWSLLCELQDRLEATQTQTAPLLQAPLCAREAILAILGMVDQ